MKHVTKSEKVIAVLGVTTSSILFLCQLNSFIFNNRADSVEVVSKTEFERLLRRYQSHKADEMEKIDDSGLEISSEVKTGEVSIRYEFDFPFEGALNHLIHEEGLRDRAYDDGRGIRTIGIGHNLEANPLCKGSIKAQFLCNLRNAETGARKFVGDDAVWEKMGDYRRLALVSMVFQMGLGELMTWKQLRLAIQKQDWKLASLRASQSKWAKDSKRGTPARAKRVCAMLADNKLVLRDNHPEYDWEELAPKAR